MHNLRDKKFLCKNETKPEQNKTRQNGNQDFLSNQGTVFKTFKRKKNHRELKTTSTPTLFII